MILIQTTKRDGFLRTLQLSFHNAVLRTVIRFLQLGFHLNNQAVGFYAATVVQICI